MKQSYFILFLINLCFNLLLNFQSIGQKLNYYPFLNGEKYGLCDDKGKLIVNPIYEKIEKSYYWKDYFEALENGKMHIIDSKGNVIFSSIKHDISFNYVYEDNYKHPNNLSRKVDFTFDNKKYTAIFTYNNGILKSKTYLSFENYKEFNSIERYYVNEAKLVNEAIPVAIDSNEMNFVDENLEYIFKENFFDGFALSYKLFALAKTKGQYQLYNRDGLLLTKEPFSDALSTDRDDHAILIRGFNENKVSSLYNSLGKEIKLDINNFKSFSKNILFGYTNDFQNYQLYSYEGKSIGVVLKDVNEWRNKFIICKSVNAKYGLMNENAQWILPAEFEAMEFASNYYYTYVRNDYCGIIDTLGNIKVKVKGGNIYHEFGPIYKFKSNDFFGFVDTLGNILLEPKYSKAAAFDFKEKRIFLVKKDQKWGVLDSNQNVFIDFLYDNINLLNMEVTKDSVVYKIDSLGNIISKLYKHPKDFKFDIKSSSLVDLNGNPISSEKYSKCKIINELSEQNFFYVMQNRKQGSFSINEVYNYSGNQIVPDSFIYKESNFESLGLLYVISSTKNRNSGLKYGIINSNGEFILGPSIFPYYRIGKSMIAEINNINKTTTVYTLDGNFHSKQYPFLDYQSDNTLIRFGIKRPTSNTKKNHVVKDKLEFIDTNDCKPEYLYGYLDEYFNEVVLPKYDRLSTFQNFGLGVYREKDVVISEIFDKNGTSISKFTNVDAHFVDAPPLKTTDQKSKLDIFSAYHIIFEEIKAVSSISRLFGIMNLNGVIKLTPEYKTIIFDGRFWHCQKNGKFHVFDQQFIKILDYQDEKKSICKGFI